MVGDRVFTTISSFRLQKLSLGRLFSWKMLKITSVLGLGSTGSVCSSIVAELINR